MKIPKRCKVTILGDSIPKGIFTQDNKLQKVHEKQSKKNPIFMW